MDNTFFLVPYSTTKKLPGKLKTIPEDFVVEEVDPKNRVVSRSGKYSFDKKSSGKFLQCVLIKENIDTISAVEKLARALRINPERITFAGTKDSKAVTAQRISIFDFHVESLENLAVEGITVVPISYGGKVFLGDLVGNRFTITVRSIHATAKEIQHLVEDTLQQLSGTFPNYFGEQRFGGDSPFTHIVGRHILEGDFKAAVETYLESGREFGIYEKRIREELEMFPDNYVGALKQFPFSLRRMFVHAYQSYLFNRTLAALVHDQEKPTKIPIVGYEYKSPLIKTKEWDMMDKILKEEKIVPSQFRIKELPDLSSAGETRPAFSTFSDLQIVSIDKDEINKGRQKVVLSFTLKKGSYATVLLREFFLL